MSDGDKVIQLLEEIRDLQQQHVLNYQDALKNQREAIDLQKRAIRRVAFFGLLLVAGFLIIFLITH